jgi:hypothetical protein
MTLSAEEWRPVVGYEGSYSVSNCGRVRRERTFARGRLAGGILAGSVFRHGYTYVELTHQTSRKKRKHTRHRLVAAAFLGIPSPGVQVNHKNGDKTDNSLANLEYVTSRENIRHSIDVLGRRRGELVNTARLTEHEVRSVKTLLSTGMAINLIASTYNVQPAAISKIKHRRTWRHVA